MASRSRGLYQGISISGGDSHLGDVVTHIQNVQDANFHIYIPCKRTKVVSEVMHS